MKILFINNVYNQGSTGKIVADLCFGLKQRSINICVAYGRGPKSNVPNVYRLGSPFILKLQSLFSKITGYSYKCSPITTYRLFQIIKKEKPDIVNIQCVNANTLNLAQTIEYLKKRGIKTILTPHAEFLYTGGCGHAFDCEQWKTGCRKCPQFKSPNSYCPKSFFFDRCREQWLDLQRAYSNFKEMIIVGTSPWSISRMQESPFFQENKIYTIYNGINTDTFAPCDTSSLREKLGLKDESVILHVTPNFYTPLKGGRYVLEIAKRLQQENVRARIIIVGYNGDGSDLPANIIPVKRTNTQQELAAYYSLADVTLLTSEREVFSMVCAESLSCGTPVVGFKAGGPEGISLKNHSEFVDYGNVDKLYSTLKTWLNHKSEHPISITEARHAYSREMMNERFFNLVSDMTK